MIAIKNDMNEVSSLPLNLSQAIERVRTMPPAAESPCNNLKNTKEHILGESAQASDDKVNITKHTNKGLILP